MKRYAFFVDSVKWTDNKYEKVCRIKVIKYKCPICGYEHEWDNTWTDEKKAEVKEELETHYNEHIIPDE